MTGLLAYAFDELGLNQVEIACAEANTRSCAIPERLGFTREGLRHDRGGVVTPGPSKMSHGGTGTREKDGAAAQTNR